MFLLFPFRRGAASEYTGTEIGGGGGIMGVDVDKFELEGDVILNTKGIFSFREEAKQQDR